MKRKKKHNIMQGFDFSTATMTQKWSTQSTAVPLHSSTLSTTNFSSTFPISVGPTDEASKSYNVQTKNKNRI